MEPRGQVVKAMAVIRRPRDGALLVSEGVTPAGELFHRPLGGHVEFGEQRFRAACPDDAHAIAGLHADSWRRHYRGGYSDAFLDGDVAASADVTFTSSGI